MTGIAGRLFLLRELVARDWRSRYAGSVLSFTWAFAQPAAQLVLFTFVFSTVLRVPAAGSPGDFAVFLFCGLLPWIGLSEGVQRSTMALTEGSYLVRKHRFPAELLVVSTVLSALIQQLAAGVVFVVALGLTRGLPWERLVLWPVLLGLQALLSVGLGLLLSVGQVLLKDVAQAVGLLLMVWFYATPIIYPSAMVPARYALLRDANPLGLLVDGHRWMLLADKPPALAACIWFAGIVIGLLLAGIWFFGRARPTLADEL